MRILLVFLIMAFNGLAQGNLQYNQAILLSTSQSSNTLLGTVPTGKVWKVEGFGTSATSYYSCGFSFDGINTFVRAGGVDNYSSGITYSVDNDNIWLPSGTPVWALSCNYHRWLSVIEFNVVP